VQRGTSAPRDAWPTFFFVGEYPVNGNPPALLLLSLLILALFQKRLDTPAHRSDAWDDGEKGARVASATLLLVMAAEGALGKGGAHNMVLFSDFFL
jgi:hypothetical protein